MSHCHCCPQLILDKAATTALMTEEIIRLNLCKIQRAYSILEKGKGVIEEDDE